MSCSFASPLNPEDTLMSLEWPRIRAASLAGALPGALALAAVVVCTWDSFRLGQSFAFTEYLRTFVHQLRRELEDDPSSPEYLLTELHCGYRFRES